MRDFNHTVNVLVKAYFNGFLIKMSCKACAVGNLVADGMGWQNVISCEIDDFCNKVTNYYWPKCIQYGDIKTTDFTIWRGKITVLSGGFPCQPYSLAGMRKGKDDDNHLWPEMRRAVREIQPPIVVGENVRGIISWNKGIVRF